MGVDYGDCDGSVTGYYVGPPTTPCAESGGR